MPPNQATLLGLRGLLLHADYTRELADRRLASGLRLSDADRVVREGMENPDLYTKRIDEKVFDRWDLSRVRKDDVKSGTYRYRTRLAPTYRYGMLLQALLRIRNKIRIILGPGTTC